MKTLIFAVFLFCSTQAFAQVKVIGIEIPGLHDKSGNGEYDKIVNKALVSKGKAILKVLPPARAEAEFKNCNNCCFSPANKNPDFYDFGSDIVQTKPMNTAKVYIFTAPGSTIISSLDGLKGKKIGTRKGMPYGNAFNNAGLTVNEVSDIEKNITKLKNGRIDAFVAYVPDAYIAFDAMGIPAFPHAEDKPIATHPDSLVCRGVDKEIINTFNAQL